MTKTINAFMNDRPLNDESESNDLNVIKKYIFFVAQRKLLSATI